MDTDPQPVPDADTGQLLTDEFSDLGEFIIDYSELEKSLSEGDAANLDIRYGENEDCVKKMHKEILCNLGLVKYFEKKEEISLQEAMTKSSGQLDSICDIPWFVLMRVMMLDYRGRDDIFSDVIKNSFQTNPEFQKNFSGFMDDLDQLCSSLDEKVSIGTSSHFPHPMDVLTAVILCSSNFLRQTLCEKLFMCKLSIPLIIPPVLDRKSLYLLWSLRSTILEHRLPSGELGETSVVKCRIPIVSCLRLGDIPRSKSKFLNEILNDQTHPTFFHRDCENGIYQRILSEGSLEIAWYSSVEQIRDSDCLGESVAVMNLRGDGKSDRACEGKKFLCEVSNVVLVMIDIAELGKPDSIEHLRSVMIHNKQLILMITNQTRIKSTETIVSSIRECATSLKSYGFLENNIIFDYRDGREQNVKVLKKDTIGKIKKCLGREHKEMTLEECQKVAEDLNITNDESSLECSNGKQRASSLLQTICKNGKDNLKEKNLPLQCRPWQEWAKLNTEEHRQVKKGTASTAAYMNDIFNKKRSMRQEQLQLIEGHHILYNVFLNRGPESNNLENLYFLKWLKLHLDEISRQITPGLQKKCSEKWNEIRQCETGEINPDLQVELEMCEKELSESSFGIEHFFREVAQAYEAVSYMANEADKEIKQHIDHLPRIMAELMLHGYPLEIMDGDACHIPLKWVQAVLTQLSEVTNNKKVFVLSVLGVQSSGKSTLLNTMFGLQFAVAAGRCTRGIFAQLLPVCAEFCGSKYDYILVLDTEGLRAAELGIAKLKHDNEIATLVIGLGDVTLVNIKGENVSELEDILQIVIHALLKMRLVNKELSLQPSCIFVHQNVSAQDPFQRLGTGQRKLMETLDKVTEAAGKQEDASNYTLFKQIINFDINKDIFYIPDLWKGDPPMASANPSYSENVKQIKQILLTSVMLNRPLHHTISQFCSRLKDIWDGVLEQNFVFSFRNSLEIDAYNALESEQADISWMLKSAEMEWFGGKRNLIENRENELDELRLTLTTKFRVHLHQVYQQATERLENYFLNNEYQSLFEQWRTNATLKLQTLYQNITENAFENIKTEISKRKNKLNEKKYMQTNLIKIMDEAKKLAEELKLPNNENQPKGEEELKIIFDDKWDEWMRLIPENPKKNLDIQREIDNILDNSHTLDFVLLKTARKERHCTIARDNFTYAIKRCVSKKKAKASLLYPFTSKIDVASNFLDELLKNVLSLFGEDIQITPENCTHKLIGLVKDEMKEMKSYLTFKNEKKFEICIIMFTWQCACFWNHRFLEKKHEKDTENELVDDGIHPSFEKVLLQYFPHNAKTVANEIRERLAHQRSSSYFNVTQKHIQNTNLTEQDALAHIQLLVNDLFKDVQSYIDKIGIQCFREFYIEEIIRMVINLENQCKNAMTFLTKAFRNELVVYLCQYSLPMFCEKQKSYLESFDQRLNYKRDNYGPCFESFLNFYFNFTNEQSLAKVLAERLCNAIKKAIDSDMTRDLVEDVRHNVLEVRLKSNFLKGVLRKLLETDDFSHFNLYLQDRDAQLQRWLSYFIDQYLFVSKIDGLNRYTQIAFGNIERLIKVTCEMIMEPLTSTTEKSLNSWLEEFIQRVTDKLPLPRQDFLSLANGYEIVSLETFASKLNDELRNTQKQLKDTFKTRTPAYLKILQENNVYKIIANECKGCTEKCPFCYAPCSLNSSGHIASGIDHAAVTHQPQACGKYRDTISKKLVIDNCEALVVSDISFKCPESNWESHPYKDYKNIFPNWKIQGDASVEATPYWKWFLVKYESQLAEIYDAERPDIPSSWKTITKEDALNSLGH
ncbi:interferon-induced very large GTPase 1-like [Palaemon carinicauda]|uniref:interferon-induced very large GTPase 1-like n=1 Tax=Palaemon carinicauda TaxID=392227 RepID=UPI0035B5D3C1